MQKFRALSQKLSEIVRFEFFKTHEILSDLTHENHRNSLNF